MDVITFWTLDVGPGQRYSQHYRCVMAYRILGIDCEKDGFPPVHITCRIAGKTDNTPQPRVLDSLQTTGVNVVDESGPAHGVMTLATVDRYDAFYQDSPRSLPVRLTHYISHRRLPIRAFSTPRYAVQRYAHTARTEQRITRTHCWRGIHTPPAALFLDHYLTYHHPSTAHLAPPDYAVAAAAC